MNQQTDNMYIDDRYSDEALRKREEIREHISWFREFLTFGTSLPEHIRRRYGLEEDYQRYKKLEIQVHRMPAEPDCRGYGKEQRMKELCEAGRAKGKITLAVEKAYESICPAPARDYLEEKYQGKIEKLESLNIDISSKMIRSWIEKGRSLAYYVPDQVIEYIQKNNIYKDCDEDEV